MSVVGIGGIAYVMLSKNKEPEKPIEPPKPVAPPPASSKKVEPAKTNLLLELPPDVRKEIYGRLASFSDQVDPIEREIVKIEKIEDPAQRREKLDEARDKLSAIADGITEVLEDKKYEKYTKDERYGHNFASYWQRLNFYTARLNQLKKKSDDAFNELKAAEAKGKEKEGG